MYRERFHREIGFSVSQFTLVSVPVPVPSPVPVPVPFPVPFPDFLVFHTPDKSVTFARPVVCTFQCLISSCNKCYLIFLYIDATGYWLHLGDFYSSSPCLEVFLIHDERSKHLVKR